MKNILLIDDSRTILKGLMRRVLDGGKLNPVVSENYRQAETVVLQKNIFVAIADLVLPDSPNGEIVELLLKNNIPTIVLSGSTDPKMRNALLRQKIVDYVVKEGVDDLNRAVSIAENLLFLRNIKILVVAEGKVLAGELKHYLEPLLFSIIHVQSKDEAFAMLKKHSDIKMIFLTNEFSGTTGPDIVRAIRTHFSHSYLIIGVSANSDDATRYRFLKNGANDCVFRPILKEEFNVRVINSMMLIQQSEVIRKQMAIMNNHVISSTTDPNGTIVAVSDAFVEICGYSREELIGINHNILRHEEMSDDLYRSLWTTITQKKEWNGEVKNRKKDGTSYWVYAQITPLLDSDGEITGYTSIRHDITAQKLVEEKSQQLEEAQKKILDSIRFSAVIQGSLMPSEDIIELMLPDHFVIWEPKDIVGGDIYQFTLCPGGFYAMVFDCTGHGVPGAFMTMVVKSILNNAFSKRKNFTPAELLRILNREVQSILQQDKEYAVSDSGLDGAIIKYDSEQGEVVFAGAKTPLFYRENGSIKIEKGDRHSLGYRKSEPSFEFNNVHIPIRGKVDFYLSTDGFLDQNGGEKGFPFGKNRFQALLEDLAGVAIRDQRALLLKALHDYQGDEERNDDVTMFGFSLTGHLPQERYIDFKGKLTQERLTELTEKIDQIGDYYPNITRLMSKIQIVFIEMAQNIINYSLRYCTNDCSDFEDDRLWISYNADSNYVSVYAANVTDKNTCNTLQEKVKKVNALSRDEVKEAYKALRRSGEFAHEKGAGIGFYEIAKQSGAKIHVKCEHVAESYVQFSLQVDIAL